MAKPRASTLLLIIAFLASAVAAANFYANFTSEHARRVQTETQLEAVTRAKEALEEERDELTKTKDTLEGQVAQLAKKAQEVADQFAQEKRAREALTAELAQVRKDATQVKGQLESERKEKETLNQDLSKAKQSYQALSNELTTLRQAKEALEKRVKEMLAARAKEAEQIVVKPAGTETGSPVPAAPQLQGKEIKVLVVNREYHFVVLNQGTRDGIRKGSRFSIWHDGKQVATADADKLYDNMTAANLLEEAKKGDVKEGDVARLIS